MYSIGIDLGGTNIKTALINDGNVLQRKMIPVNPDKNLSGSLDGIKIAVDEFSVGHKIEGIGFSFPGIVDPYSKKVKSVFGKFNDALEMDLEKWCRESFDLPMVLENDANAALAGEMAYGAGVGFTDAVIMILGTGVGTAAFIDNRLLHGKHFQAGCMGGHFIVDPKGEECCCKGSGCIEACASTWALDRIAKNDDLFGSSGLSGEEKIDFDILEKWYKQGDKLALKIFDRCADVFGACGVDLVHAYDPEVVILSGGVMNFEDLTQSVIKKIKEKAFMPWGDLQIKPAAAKQNSVLLGLHKLLIDEL